MRALSPGVAQGCFYLLDLVSRRPIRVSELLTSFSQLESLPSGEVLAVAQGLNWIAVGPDETLDLTVSGMRLRDCGGYEPMLRRALLDYVHVASQPWVQNAPYGRRRVIAFIRPEVGQIFVEAGLADGVSDEVVAFWDELISIARGRRNDRLVEIGRQGERLSIAYEFQRTQNRPKWVAIDNNADGYDILSVVDSHNKSALTIEVKTTSSGIGGAFYVTRNEWEIANVSQSHKFHLWIIDIKSTHRLAVVGPDQIAPHISTDMGDGEWQSVQLQYRSFAEYFQCVGTGGDA